MNDKYLSEEELEKFIAWCKKNKITQKEVAEICGMHEQWISKVFTARRSRRNKNFKKDPEELLKPKFERARARLVLLTKKEEALRSFIEI